MEAGSLFSGRQVVFVLGGPGAGKGTQCEMMAEKYYVGHLSVGDVLRAERDNPSSPYAEIIRKNMEQGKVGPMEITVKLLRNAMENLSTEVELILLDGFPRKLDQFTLFETTICPASFALFLDCPQEQQMARLSKRGESGTRQDDSPEIIIKRLETFKHVAMQVVDALEKDNRLFRLDASLPPEKVFKCVEQILQSRFSLRLRQEGHTQVAAVEC